jgi:hypothetical protein
MPLATVTAAFAAGFLANMTFVVSSRTGADLMPVLLLLFVTRYLEARAMPLLHMRNTPRQIVPRRPVSVWK